MKLWIRIDAALPRDPEVAELATRVGVKKAEAIGLLMGVWSAIAEHRPSGSVQDISAATLEDWANYEPRGKVRSGAFAEAFIALFTRDGNVRGWKDRQGKLIERAEKDRLRKHPDPPSEVSTEIPRKFHGISTPTERNGTERNETLRTSSRITDQSGEEAQSGSNGTSPRVALPREAENFLAMFYEPALTESSRKRRKDVKAQLYDVLDSKHPGPKIRGGIRVKARSVEHLADECKAVMKDPPPDRDLAIVWLLKRLTNPPKGPTETERMKSAEQSRRQLEDQYHAALTRAGGEWARDHADDYKPILAAVEANYRGRSGSAVELMKKTELAQKCARKANFPDFDTWLSQRTPNQNVGAATSSPRSR